MREYYEGAVVSKEDVHKVQDCSAAWSSAGDLREPQAQAAAGMIRAEPRRPDLTGVAGKMDETGGLRWQELRAWICRLRNARK